MEEGHIFSWTEQHVTSSGRDKGVYPEHTSPVLTVVKVKNGIAEIISTPKATNLDFKTFSNAIKFSDVEITLEDKTLINGEKFIENSSYYVKAKSDSMDQMGHGEVTDKRLKIRKLINSQKKSGEFIYYKYVDGERRRKQGTYSIKDGTVKEVVTTKYNFNTTNIKHLLFNEIPTYHDITDLTPVIIKNNEVRVSVNVTAAFYDGWWSNDDWLQLLLAQLCVYKLS